MPRKQHLSTIWLVLWTLLPMALYISLRLMENPHRAPMAMPIAHFYVVSAVSIIAALCSTVIGWVGIRLRNVNVLLVALALMSLSGFFVIHGLSTPGVIVDVDGNYHVPAVASQLSVTSAAMWLVLSSFPSDHRLIRSISRHNRWWAGGWLTFLLLTGVASLINPDIANWVPVDLKPINYMMAIVTIGLCSVAAFRYLAQYRFGHFPVQLAVTLSLLWLCDAQVIMVTSIPWTAAWWIYHFLLLFAACIILYGVIRQYASGASLTETFRIMFSTNPVDRIESGISRAIRALIVATETKDSYTAGHNFRVAMYALQLGDRMRLSPETLRALAQGAVVHDVGKIEVPEHILNKPGALTPEERRIIEQHPLTGYAMCQSIGFMRDELDVIRSHHEKWDGTGYPDGLKGVAIPMLARVLAIADVYDALTSARSYRQPWSPEKALQFIRDQAGSHFDPACVEAWVQICESGSLTAPDGAAWHTAAVAVERR